MASRGLILSSMALSVLALGSGFLANRPLSLVLIFFGGFGLWTSVALAAGAMVAAWRESRWRLISRRFFPSSHPLGRPCTSCHRTMSEVKLTWVCPSCDHVLV